MSTSTTNKQNYFDKISSMTLAVYHNKLVAYIQDADKSAMLMRQQLLFDEPYYQVPDKEELKEGIKWLNKASLDAQDMANKIALELERRMKKDIRFFMDYKIMSKYVFKAENIQRNIMEERNKWELEQGSKKNIIKPDIKIIQ